MLEREMVECDQIYRWDFQKFSNEGQICKAELEMCHQPKNKYFPETWILPFAVLSAMVAYAITAIVFYNTDAVWLHFQDGTFQFLTVLTGVLGLGKYVKRPLSVVIVLIFNI